ncbi:MAG: hypothetical protein KAU95_03625 [Candidatus Aenigmarchaeota archaeon]|nr:hypothetical protein [Candidatus Aenigmarchaeota archaeon]
MFREIKEGLKGRKKISDDFIDYEMGQDILKELDESVQIEVYAKIFTCPPKGFPFKIFKEKPDAVLKFIKENFDPDVIDGYSGGRYQVYTGKGGERHYIDLCEDRKKGHLGNRATLTYSTKIL